jgi:formamidopyrimidine-DNA glycosylase
MRWRTRCWISRGLSYHTRGQVDDNKHHGALFRFKVFHRDGERCERCGGVIEKTMLSSRPFYWCPDASIKNAPAGAFFHPRQQD